MPLCFQHVLGDDDDLMTTRRTVHLAVGYIREEYIATVNTDTSWTVPTHGFSFDMRAIAQQMGVATITIQMNSGTP